MYCAVAQEQFKSIEIFVHMHSEFTARSGVKHSLLLVSGEFCFKKLGEFFLEIT